MSSPIPQTVVMLQASMAQDQTTARIDAKNFEKGSVTASWTSNDALDALLSMQGSADGSNWGSIGNTADDVGSVTLSTANDSQIWSFREGFPFDFIRMTFAHGTNTAGSLLVVFSGYLKGTA